MAEENKPLNTILLGLAFIACIGAAVLLTYFLTSHSNDEHFKARLTEEVAKRKAIEQQLDSVSAYQRERAEQAALWILRSDSSEAVAQATAKNREALKKSYEQNISTVSSWSDRELDSLFAK